MGLTITKGSIWSADLTRVFKEDEETHRQKGDRPVVIFSNNKFNIDSPVINIIPLSKEVEKKSPVHVFVDRDCGIRLLSIALVEQKTTIDKIDLKFKIGECTADVLYKINRAVIFQESLEEPFNISKCIKLVKAILNAQNIIFTFKIPQEEAFFIQPLTGELKTYCNQHGKDYYKVFDYCSKYISTPEYIQKVAVCR